MRWELSENRFRKDTVEGKIFQALKKLEQIRKSKKPFVSYADTWTDETNDSSVLCIGRYLEGEKIIGLFNFSEFDKTVHFEEDNGVYTDLMTQKKRTLDEVNLPGYGFFYLEKEIKEP